MSIIKNHRMDYQYQCQVNLHPRVSHTPSVVSGGMQPDEKFLLGGVAAGALIGAAAFAFGAFDGDPDPGGVNKCTVDVGGRQVEIKDMNYTEVNEAIKGSKIALTDESGQCTAALNNFAQNPAPDMASYVTVSGSCGTATLQKTGTSCNLVSFSDLMPCRVKLNEGLKKDMRKLTLAELANNIGKNQEADTDLVLETVRGDVNACTLALTDDQLSISAINEACSNVSVTTSNNADTCRVEVNSLPYGD